jgi:transcriptional regulator with XRE-family HTH domain
MSGLTPFGKALRKLRVDKEMRLFDLAELLNRSTAFLSAVETGRKGIPDGFVVEISRAMNLNAAEIKELRAAADRTRKEVPVGSLSADQREIVAAFARRLDDVPESLLEELRRRVMKSIGGEIPFQRKRRGFIVPPMSTGNLRQLAEKVRDIFVDPARIDFPIVEVLEIKLPRLLPDFVFDVQDRAAMGDDEGRVPIGQNALILRSDVYEDACRSDRRARFTACHELAHFVMHRSISFARARGDNDKIYYDSEWQADTFAGTLLMSPRHVSKFPDAVTAADACKMNPAAAKVMFSKYAAEGLINSATLGRVG